MGIISSPAPVLAIVAALSRYPARWLGPPNGPPRQASGRLLCGASHVSVETDYYQERIGTHLEKCFSAEPLVDPARLAELEAHDGGWEEEYAAARPASGAAAAEP